MNTQWYPKYFHATVPHSGTRFVNEAFKKHKIKIAQKHSHRGDKWTDMVFCHIGPNWVPYLEDCVENSELAWMTVRDPIATWGTHYYTVKDTFKLGDYAYKNKLSRMRGQYETQMSIAHQFDHIHRVDMDSMASLGEFVGLDLDQDNDRFSRYSPMKDAIRDKNTKEIARLCEGTEFWTCFVESITPDIADFYTDIGYDIWWNNG